MITQSVERQEQLRQEQRREWLANRQKYIGSSDVPAILGCGYADQSITSVWRSKLADAGDDLKRSKSSEELMQEGARNEPLVVQAFAMRHPEWKVTGFEYELRVCDSYPFLAASLDAEVETESGEKFPLECKWIQNPSVQVDGQWVNEWVDDNCPMKHQFQNLHQQLCTGARRGCVAAFVRGEYCERWVDWDDEVVEWMVSECERFWRHVVDRTPPPESKAIEVQAARTEAVSKGTAKLLGAELSEKVREVIAAQKEIDRTRKRVGVLVGAVAARAGSAEYLLLDKGEAIKLNKSTLQQVPRLPRHVVVE